MDNNIAHILRKASEILDEQFLRDKELEQKTLEQMKLDFDFYEMIGTFNQGKVPDSLEFFYGSENESFYIKCKLLDLNDKNKRFADFLNTAYCLCIGRENKLLIHIENGNIYCDNLNTNESIYNFILAQRVDSKNF